MLLQLWLAATAVTVTLAVILGNQYLCVRLRTCVRACVCVHACVRAFMRAGVQACVRRAWVCMGVYVCAC